MARKAHNLKWTEATIREAAARYASRSAFECALGKAVHVARTKYPGLLDELFPKLIRVKWTEAEIREEAKRYASKIEFQKKSTAEQAARRLGIIDDLGFPPQKYWLRWTEVEIRKEASKYQTKREFEKNARGASERARVTGIIDTLGLLEYPPSDNDVVYIWRAVGQFFNGDPVYKFGVTSSRLGSSRIEQVARAAGFDFEVICSAKVTGKASRIESRLLALGVSPRYYGFNGASEFRALSPSALTTAVEIVASMLDNSN